MKITCSYLVTTFFTSYLTGECGLSPNTIASYSDCMRLLIGYICERCHIDPEAIDLSHIDQPLVLDFLGSLEEQRGNSSVTRNQRLGAIKTFFRFLALHVPELMHQNEQIQAIELKRTDHLPPPSLSVEQITALLRAPEPTSLLGKRDRALLLLLYNTGARVQELADLRIGDIRFEAPGSISLTGKGRKTRTLPLWEQTLELIGEYLQHRPPSSGPSDLLFLSIRGEPITRFGIGRRLKKHAARAAKDCPSLLGQSIHPHLIRHTTALHLIEAGNDIALVRDWLGHADIKTTSQYLEVSLARKRKALEQFPAPDPRSSSEPPKWKDPALLAFLKQCSRKQHYVAKNQVA